MPRRQPGSTTRFGQFAGRLILVAITLLSVGYFSKAEPEPEKEKARAVRITFIPPPIDGTISLGIYDKSGKLVRVLHREATEQEFTVGLNGLTTHWDGRDEGGIPVPPGTYRARGFSVGALEIEGEAYHCNDFIADVDSPRVHQINDLHVSPDGDPVLSVTLAGGVNAELVLDANGAVKSQHPSSPEPTHGGATDREAGDDVNTHANSDLQQPLDMARGKDDTRWFVDETPEGTEVKQYSATGEFLRRLAPSHGEPAPAKIAASQMADHIYLLEAAPGVQRVRGLAREDAPIPVQAETGDSPNRSTWRTLFSKQIVSCDDFSTCAGKSDRLQHFTAEPRITIRLVPNPLYKNQPVTASFEIAHDSEGSFLRTTDALPLIRLTETPNLKWSVMGRENGSRALTIFQSDGVVVEEYRARRLANMMAFDAGEYEVK